MNSLNSLIGELQKDELIIQFKKIEFLIDQDDKISDDFKKLLELQKQMVNDREKNIKNFEFSAKKYDIAKSSLTNNVVISEYIELLENINYDLQLIQNIIGYEISADFE